jgi:hypothetical protein
MDPAIALLVSQITKTKPGISKKGALGVAILLILAGAGTYYTYGNTGSSDGGSNSGTDEPTLDAGSEDPLVYENEEIADVEPTDGGKYVELRSERPKIFVEDGDIGEYRNNVNGFYHNNNTDQSKWNNVDLSKITPVLEKRPSTEYLWAKGKEIKDINGEEVLSDLESLALFEGFVEKMDPSLTSFSGHVIGTEALLAGSYRVELRSVPNLGQKINLFIDGNRLFNVNGNPHATAEDFVNYISEQKIISADTWKVLEWSGKMSNENREMWYVKDANQVVK